MIGTRRKRAGHRPDGYIQQGKHRWRMVGSYAIPGGSRGVHVCMVCGVRVDTTAPFPSKMFVEQWNGVRFAAKQPRPPCRAKEASC